MKIPAVILLASSAYGAVLNVSISGKTAQQAVIAFTTPDAAQCTIQLFTDAARTKPIDDTNDILFPGSTACNRRGSIVEGPRTSFVAGLRTSEKATDGLMHSRSLSPLTTYSYTITDEVNDTTYTGQFTTANLGTGNMYAEQVPYDPNAFGNAAYPSVDFSGDGKGCGNFQGGSKPCVDPVTGLKYWLVTSPGAHSGLATPDNGSKTVFQTPVINGGSCDSPSKMVNSPGVNFATCSGAMDATLTAQSGWTIPNTWHPVYPFGVSYKDNWFSPLGTIDDLITVISGSASDSNNGDNIVNVCLWSTTTNACLTGTFTVPLPVGSTQQFSVPHPAPKPYWQDWGYEPDQGYAAQPSIRIWRAGNSGSVSLSVSFAAASSRAWWNNESAPVRCEDDPRSIGYDRNGNAMNPAVNGYLCYVPTLNGWPEVWLWIPFNADRSVRAEARWLGPIDLSYNTNPAGWYQGNLYGSYPFSTGPTDVIKLSYNTGKYPYCHYQDLRTVTGRTNGGWYPDNGSGSQPPPCFDTTIVTNGAVNTMITAWQAQHPDFADVSHYANGGRTVYFNNGILAIQINSNPSPPSPVSIFGFFDPAGQFLGVSDNFTNHVYQNGKWLPKMGWGQSHGQILGMPGGQYVDVSVGSTSTPNAGAALAGPWTLPVLAVNRAGYGSSPLWDCAGCSGGPSQTGMITPTDHYQCPNTPLVQQLCPGGQCCVEIKVNQEPCSTTPYVATNTFAGNTKTEAQAFPCTRTDNRTVVNANWSKLQNTQVGDWLTDLGADGNWESFIVAEKVLDDSGNLSGLWFLKETAINANLWNPLPEHGLTTTRHPCINWGAGCPTTGTNLILAMREPYGQGAANATGWAFPVNGAPPLADSPVWVNCHHEDGRTLRVACGIPYYQAISSAAGFGATIFKATKSTSPFAPLFAGQDVANQNIQSYSAVAQNTQSAVTVGDQFLSWRHYNPSYGGLSFEESGYCSYSAAKATGDIYDLSAGGGDCYGRPAAPKYVPFVARANPFLLKDVSGPGSATVFAATTNSACYALMPDECFKGSTANHYYVNVPGGRFDAGCTNLYTLPASQGGSPRPCFYSAPTAGGRLEEIDATRFAPDGSSSRLLSYVHTIPGAVPQQSYPSWDPTGQFAFISGGFLDGKRPDLIALAIPPLRPNDAANRTSYRQVPVTLSGTAGDQVHVCWGYAENAPNYDPAQGLYPMPRQESGCSDASGSAPFLWAGEPQKYGPCDRGCTVTLNLISGRIAYYFIERRNGGAASRSPLRIIAVN